MITVAYLVRRIEDNQRGKLANRLRVQREFPTKRNLPF